MELQYYRDYLENKERIRKHYKCLTLQNKLKGLKTFNFFEDLSKSFEMKQWEESLFNEECNI